MMKVTCQEKGFEMKFLILLLFPLTLMAADESAVCREEAKKICKLPDGQEVISRMGCLVKNRPLLSKPCETFVNGKFRAHIDSTSKIQNSLKSPVAKSTQPVAIRMHLKSVVASIKYTKRDKPRRLARRRFSRRFRSKQKNSQACARILESK
jgi:hypothetical protein